MVIPTIEQILAQIQNLPIKETLEYLGAIKIVNYSSKGYDKIKKVIQDKWNNYFFAFVPDKKEALALKELGKHPDYKTIITLLPKYHYHDIIRTGLLIRSYLKNPTGGNKERSKSIKTEIAKRPNGKKLLNIIRLVSTPYFSVVITNLYQLKSKGYTDSQLAEEFDETINEWDNSYLPVKSTYSITEIKSFCSNQIKRRSKKFFLLGIKSAANNVEIAVEQLMKEKFFKNNGYKMTIIKDEEGVEPRVEVTIRRISELDEVFIEDS